MSLISISGPSDGQTIDAADVNTPLNTIANEINGNLDNANIKSSAAIDASKLAASSITNTQMATSVSPVTRWDEGFFDYVASGCVWTGDAYGSTRVASMTSGVVYIDGKRLTVAAVTSRTFTASKDTYVDLSDNGDGTAAIAYSEVANNAASPSLTAGRMRIAIIVTGASNIANAGSINQGQFKALLPVVSSNYLVFGDSNGKPICNRQPYGPIKTSSNNWKILDFGSYKEYTQSFNNASFAATTTAQSVWTGNAPAGITSISDIDQIFLGASSTNYGGEMTFAVEQIASGLVYITAAGTRSNTHNYTCHVKLVKYL